MRKSRCNWPTASPASQTDEDGDIAQPTPSLFPLPATTTPESDSTPEPPTRAAPDIAASLPDDVWLHDIMPLLPLGDVLSLSRTCKRMHAFTTSSWLWRSRARSTPQHAWTLSSPARGGGWALDAAMGLEASHLASLSLGPECCRWRYTPVRPSAPPRKTVPWEEGAISALGPPAFVQIEAIYGNVLGLDREGGVWVVNTRFRYLDSPYFKYGRLPLPFAVVSIAADQLYATVLSTAGDLWELGGITDWLDEKDTISRFRFIRLDGGVFCPPVKCQNGGGVGTGEEPEEDPASTMLIFAAARVGCPLMGGCVRGGHIHVWVRSGVIASALHAERSWGPMFNAARPPVFGIDDADRIVYTLPPLPDVISAAMGEDFVMVLTSSGDVFAAVVDTEVDWPRLVLTNWEAIPTLSSPGTTKLAVFGALIALAKEGVNKTVRLARLPHKPSWSQHSFGKPTVQEVHYPDMVAQIALSDDILAVVTTLGQLYTASPLGVLANPVEANVPMLAPCPVDFMFCPGHDALPILRHGRPGDRDEPVPASKNPNWDGHLELGREADSGSNASTVDALHSLAEGPEGVPPRTWWAKARRLWRRSRL